MVDLDAYPLTGFHFRVDFVFPGLAGGKDSRFKEVSGIGMTMEMETYNEGGNDGLAQYVPKGRSFDDLVLKRGMIKGSFLINWLEVQMITLKKIPVPIIVTMLSEENMPVYSWFFINAYPVKWSTAGFNSMATGDSAIMVEEITFKYSFYKQVNMSMISNAVSFASSLL